MQNYHVSTQSTAVLLAPQTDNTSEFLSVPWMSLLNDNSNVDILGNLDTLATSYLTTDQTNPQYNMSSAQDQLSSQSSDYGISSGEHGHTILSTNQIPTTQSPTMVYIPNQIIQTSAPAEENTTTISYVPAASQYNADSQKISQVNAIGQSYTFNVADYASYRYQLSQIQQGESVVTQQPQSSVNTPQPVPTSQPIRVPQPSHLISPLLAQPRPHLPSGLRNSNYLIHPIIARPSTQPQTDSGETREQNPDTPHIQEVETPQPTSSAPETEDNSVSSSHADNNLQMQMNQFSHSSMPVDFQYHIQGQQGSYEHVVTQTKHTIPDSQTIHSTPQTVHSTELLLHGGNTVPSQPGPSIPQPVCSQSSQSSSSESSDDDSDRLAIADVTQSETSSDDSSSHLRSSESHQELCHNQPVNFWEQQVASARIAASGVAHPKPVRLSSGFSSMFPPSSFPWANGGMYPQAFHPTFPGGFQTVQAESKPQVHATPNQPEPSTDHPTSTSLTQPKEEPQQAPFNHSDSLSYFLSEFPKSLDSLSNLQSHPPVCRPVVQQSTQDALPTSQTSSLPACPTPENKDPINQTGNMFSHNTFMSPSFFNHQAMTRSCVKTELPPMSSTPEVNHSPISTGKASDDDSAIDVNSGSSSTSPSSSIDNHGSPELMTLHLQNEDSNSSVGDTSLLRSRCSSVSSICDSSISSTASSASNSSFSAPRGKRSNPEPDLGNYKKKSRTSYSPGQLRALERVYMENPYPECDTIDRLARELDIAEQRLRVWFQNKRARMRRQAKQNKQVAPHPPVNPYNAQPMSAIMSSASPYSFLPPNSMMAPGQPSQMMQRPFFPYPQGAPGSIMQHPVNVSSAPGIPQHPPPLMTQQTHGITPQQSQIQRLYSFIAHKQH